MEPKIIHHNTFTIIGYSKVIPCGLGFEQCPKFWDEAYAGRFARLFKTMKAETPEEQAVLDNRIGEYAVCRRLEGQDAFSYMICGEYQDGNVPEGMQLDTIPESDWLEFRGQGPLPQGLQELNTFVHDVWMKEHDGEYKCRGIDIEWYSAGNPQSPDYEFGIFIPVVAQKNSRSICGLDCGKCDWRETCPGCAATQARPQGGSCVLAQCCFDKKLSDCGACQADGCALKKQLIGEFNELNIPDMPKVTTLNALPGSFINMEYPLDNGCKVKFWEDNRIYLGNQLEKTDASGRCYGLVADEHNLLVCEYGCDGADPEIVIYKRR